MLRDEMLSVLKEMTPGQKTVFEYSGFHMYMEKYAEVNELKNYDTMKFFDYIDDSVKEHILSPYWYFTRKNISTTINVLLNHYDKIHFTIKLQEDKCDLENTFLITTTTNAEFVTATLARSLLLESRLKRHVGFHTLYCLAELDYNKVFKEENIAVDMSDISKFLNYTRRQHDVIFMHKSTVDGTFHVKKLTNKVKFPLDSIEKQFFEEIEESVEYAY
jgi:hypothetical protein